jgi:HEAT repeat protein
MMARWLPVCVLLVFVSRGEGAAPAADPGDEKLLREAGAATDGPGLLAFLRRRTFTPDDEKRAAALVRQLGDDSYERRQQASDALAALGPVAVPHLRRAANDADPEVRRRARACLEAADSGRDAHLAGAAVRLLAARAPEGAPAALLRFLPWAGDEAVEEDALLGLVALSATGLPDPALVAALTDPAPLCRAAAALVVGRAGTAAQRDGVRRLLADADSRVRLRAAQGMLAAGSKDGLPTLLDLLTAAPADIAGRVEDLLAEVAGAGAPRVALGADDRQRRACRDAWEKWYKAQGDHLDLAKLDAEAVVFSPVRRAASVARQFLDALVGGDQAAVRRTADVPFAVAGLKQMATAAELEQFAKEVHGRAVEGKISCRMRGSVPGEEFARTGRDPAQPGGVPDGLPWRELRVVFAQVYKGNKKEMDESIYLLVRVRGGRVRVVGVGSGAPADDRVEKKLKR